MHLFADKTALITGGSDGIGLAIAKAFAKQGANTIIIGRNQKKLESARENLELFEGRVHAIKTDLSLTESIDDIAGEIHQLGIKINVLVNNAGIARFIPFADMDGAALDYHINLNIKSPYWLAKAFLNDLIDTRGNVINISSYFARKMIPDRPSTAYSLTKGALNSFTKALAFELGPKGVRVNAIAPGTVRTDQVEANIMQLSEEARGRFKTMIPNLYPLQRLGNPREIANMAVFLASDQAEWITGGVFAVDGGLTTN